MNTLNGTAPSSRIPLVRAIHTAVKGRVRYHVVGLRCSAALKQQLEQYLMTEDGIEKVAANIWTGNLLVQFNPVKLNPIKSIGTIAQLIEKLVRQYHLCHDPPALLPAGTRLDQDQHQDQRHNQDQRNGHRSPQRRNSGSYPHPIPAMTTDKQVQQVAPWHQVEASSVITTLQTSATAGLSNRTAQTNLQRYGPNVLPKTASRSRLSILINQFKSLPVALLSLAAGLSVATGGLADAVVIMGVVMINAAIGYTTESQSERIIHSLRHLVQPSALVIRDGELIEISAEAVVVGDLLVLKPGSYVAADARLSEAHRLSVDESALTGESLPVLKTIAPLAGKDIPLGDRTNMVYMGTLITGGQGLAIVVATGKFTEMGRIQALVGTTTIPETPMERQLDQAGSQLVLVSSAVCGVVFALGLLRGYGFLQMLKTSVSLAVAAVPEGLPAVATTTLALGIRDMRQHKVLIRRLDAVETLGSVQAICLDKTGTLTVNQMTVVELYTDDRIQITPEAWRSAEVTIDPQASEGLLKLLQVLVLCNESEVNGNSDCEVDFKGSSTENALLELAIAAGVEVATVRQTYPLLSTHHRSENRNFMTTLHEVPAADSALPAAANQKPAKPSSRKKTSRSKQIAATQTTATLESNPPATAVQQPWFVAMKGSPTEVLSRCNWRIQAGQVLPLTLADREAIAKENDRMAGKALRVLGVAYRYTSQPDPHQAQEDLIWLGLVGMTDPIRSGTQPLMRVFHTAGIDTIMITGDQSSTAYAIGQELNLSNGEQLQILDSTHFTSQPAVMRTLCDRVHVFARISPAHKLQIVQALQSNGKVVAMTGDGINDAPALKAADVGVAMGHVGTDVAREVADVILENDDLQTMAIAVSRGRTIYNNIRKSVHFLLSTNLSEILVMLTATGAGVGQPLNAMQLLWLNLVTDIFPGLALALDPPDPHVLRQPPRDPNEPIIKPSDFKRILFESTTLSASALGAYGYAIGRYGISPRASTIAFMSLTCGQLLHALSCRSATRRWGTNALPPNRYLAIALAGSLGLQFLSALVPGLRTLLHIAPISWLDSAVISAAAFLPLLLNEGTKPGEPGSGSDQLIAIEPA